MTDGFFSRKELDLPIRSKERTYSCYSCGLSKKCLTGKMKAYGEYKKRILVVGEAPGEQEDRVGKPWQGKAGKLLQSTLSSLGIDLFEDCLSINACLCRPVDEDGNNRTPSNYEIECCRKEVLKTIEERKPQLILAFGNSAIYSLLGHRWKKDLSTISKWRGWQIPDQDFKAWLCFTFHPSYIERNPGGVEEIIFRRDIEDALSLLNKKLPVYVEPEIEIITDLSPLYSIKDESAFDYETTGIKPHQAGHRIVCTSIADSVNHVYVFMMPETRKELRPFIDYLKNPDLPKIAQNMKFEDTWSDIILKCIVEGWIWDTMLASHILDNRTGTTGLKFQSYVQLGIVDYASEISPWLESGSKDANAFNRILDLLKEYGGKEKLLKYNGYDSINELRLSILQRNIIP